MGRIVVTGRVPEPALDLLREAGELDYHSQETALSVAELVRILVDEHKFVLSTALELTRATIAYTNHTLLPEALESWPVQLIERLLPRHMQIIYQINAVHLAQVAGRKEIAPDRAASLSLINEQGGRRVRMGHLAFIGSHRVNGVSGLHGKLMRETVFRDLNQLYPDRITHITNGITIRRWLLENDHIEAIVALPTDIFFRTGIGTYIWLLTNNKAKVRREGRDLRIRQTDDLRGGEAGALQAGVGGAVEEAAGLALVGAPVLRAVGGDRPADARGADGDVVVERGREHFSFRLQCTAHVRRR